MRRTRGDSPRCRGDNVAGHRSPEEVARGFSGTDGTATLWRDGIGVPSRCARRSLGREEAVILAFDLSAGLSLLRGEYEEGPILAVTLVPAFERLCADLGVINGIRFDETFFEEPAAAAQLAAITGRASSGRVLGWGVGGGARRSAGTRRARRKAARRWLYSARARLSRTVDRGPRCHRT